MHICKHPAHFIMTKFNVPLIYTITFPSASSFLFLVPSITIWTRLKLYKHKARGNWSYYSVSGIQIFTGRFFMKWILWLDTVYTLYTYTVYAIHFKQDGVKKKLHSCGIFLNSKRVREKGRRRIEQIFIIRYNLKFIKVSISVISINNSMFNM